METTVSVAVEAFVLFFCGAVVLIGVGTDLLSFGVSVWFSGAVLCTSLDFISLFFAPFVFALWDLFTIDSDDNLSFSVFSAQLFFSLSFCLRFLASTSL